MSEDVLQGKKAYVVSWETSVVVIADSASEAANLGAEGIRDEGASENDVDTHEYVARIRDFKPSPPCPPGAWHDGCLVYGNHSGDISLGDVHDALVARARSEANAAKQISFDSLLQKGSKP